MFLTFDEDKCPVCGTLGKESSIQDLSNCPQCGTKFNEFGIITTPQRSPDVHWS